MRTVTHINPAIEEFGEQFTQLDPDAMTAEEGDLLYALVRMRKPELAIETGTGSGRATFRIAEALQANGKGNLISCDLERDYVQNAQMMLSGFPAEIRQATGLQVLRGLVVDRDLGKPIPEFILIDAGGVENRMQELAFIVEKDLLSEKGILVIHDARNPGRQGHGDYRTLPAILKSEGWPGFVMQSLAGIAIFQKP